MRKVLEVNLHKDKKIANVFNELPRKRGHYWCHVEQIALFDGEDSFLYAKPLLLCLKPAENLPYFQLLSIPQQFQKYSLRAV